MNARSACVALLLWVAAGTAVADEDVALRRMRFAEHQGRLVVTASFTELFDAAAFERLASGFPTTVVVRVWVYRVGNDIPLSFALASYRVVYDLWDEDYTIRVDGPDGPSVARVRGRAAALARLTTLAKFPIASLERIAIGPHYQLGLAVELNPVAPELLAETRRWLSKPAGKGRLDASTSMFGSFVSVFVNPKLNEAERVLRYRSQPFYRVPARAGATAKERR